MPQVIRVAAAIGTALLLGITAAWPPAGRLAQPGGAGTALPGAPDQMWQSPRYGPGQPTTRPAGASLPGSAYMVVNGHVFRLGDVLACAHWLHAARIS